MDVFKTFRFFLSVVVLWVCFILQNTKVQKSARCSTEAKMPASALEVITTGKGYHNFASISGCSSALTGSRLKQHQKTASLAKAWRHGAVASNENPLVRLELEKNIVKWSFILIHEWMKNLHDSTLFHCFC